MKKLILGYMVKVRPQQCLSPCIVIKGQQGRHLMKDMSGVHDIVAIEPAQEAMWHAVSVRCREIVWPMQRNNCPGQIAAQSNGTISGVSSSTCSTSGGTRGYAEPIGYGNGMESRRISIDRVRVHWYCDHCSNTRESLSSAWRQCGAAAAMHPEAPRGIGRSTLDSWPQPQLLEWCSPHCELEQSHPHQRSIELTKYK
jgi:hypothetical protein